jgi:hypothetical protein
VARHLFAGGAFVWLPRYDLPRLSFLLGCDGCVVSDASLPLHSTDHNVEPCFEIVHACRRQFARPFENQGEQLGPQDHIVEWHRPRRREAKTGADEAAYQALPETIRVREFLIDIEGRNGRGEKAIVISTMTDPAIPQKQLSDLYWKRWNCELDLRSLKHSLNMDVLRSKTPEMAHKELWAGILAYNLLRGTMSESAKRSGVMPRELSVKGTMQTVESFTPAMMVMNGNEQLYDAFLTAVSARRVGNRPGRQEPRLKKRRPVWTQMMMKSRGEHFRRLKTKAAR